MNESKDFSRFKGFCQIIFYNDELVYNDRYRKEVMGIYKLRGHKVMSRKIHILSVIFRKRSSYIFGSNIRTNLKLLCLVPFSPKTIIINGIGRYRSRRTLKILSFLMLIQSNKTRLVIQNYCDYRFFRRLKIQNLHFICGSGGTERHIQGEGVFVVSRRDKFFTTLLSLESLSSDFAISHINVVGLDEPKDKLSNSVDFNFVGFLSQKDIIQGKTFICPEGYGEGFPHTLADAIVSGCIIIVGKRDFINFGLYLYQKEFDIGNTGVRFRPSFELQNALKISTISEQYCIDLL